MSEKKIQENPLPEETQTEPEKPKVMVTEKVPGKDKETATVVVPAPTLVTTPSVPSFMKTPPNELYRRLLPAVLFLLTFVTVMTILLIYMDTVALGAQQFRVNMSRDYELSRIPQESAVLVAFVRQLHLAPRAPALPPPEPEPTERVAILDNLLGEVYNGTFVEFLPRGPRDPTTQYLESARQWSGVAVRAAPRDYLALRGAARAMHACMSPSPHPREVTYQEHEESGGSGLFPSRVLCFPLYTVLAAAHALRAHYTVLASAHLPSQLHHLPFHATSLKVIEVRSTDPMALNQTTQFLLKKNYTVAATFPDAVMYVLNGITKIN